MYSDYYPYIIFGWNEGNTNDIVDTEYVSSEYDIEYFSGEVVRQSSTEAYYGLVCEFDTDGTITIRDKDKQKVIDAYNKWCDYHKNNGDERIEYTTLGFHIVMLGDILFEQDSYIPK